MEYREARVEVDVAAGREATAQVDLERWTDPPGRGWWGGESHIHANYGYGQWYNTPATIRLQVEGEDLNLANLMVANSDTDGIFDREFFRGEPIRFRRRDTSSIGTRNSAHAVGTHDAPQPEAPGRADHDRLSGHDEPLGPADERGYRR